MGYRRDPSLSANQIASTHSAIWFSTLAWQKFAEAAKRSRHLDASSVTLARAATTAVATMSCREGTASSEAQPCACPLLCTPLEGLRAWLDRHSSAFSPFAYVFLEDSTRRERARLDARALAHRVALARDGLSELLREKGVRPSPWTRDVVRPRPDRGAREALPEETGSSLLQQTVVLAFPPGFEFLVAFLACQACGAVAVPARPPDPAAAAARFAEERDALVGVAAASGARLVLTSRSYAVAFALADARRDVARRVFAFRHDTRRAPGQTRRSSCRLAGVAYVL